MVPSAKHQARIYLRAARDLCAGLCCGVVPLQPRPHAAVHTRSNDRSNIRATEGRRRSRCRRECTGVTRQRARVRVGVSHLQMGSQAHVSCVVTSMKQFCYAFSSLVLIFALASVCSAQGDESPCDKIEKSLSSKASSWKITRKSRSPCQPLSYFKLESGKASVYIFIFPGKSAEEARTTFQFLATAEEWCERYDILGSGWRTSYEENRVWKCWSTQGVDVKKGRVVVRVSASTIKLSREFAEVIGNALPDA